jgi:hypothetical protein
MEQNASLEVKLVKNLLAFKKPEGSLTYYGNPLLVPLHGQINPAHTFHPTSFKILFTVILPSTLGSSKCSFSFRVP